MVGLVNGLDKEGIGLYKSDDQKSDGRPDVRYAQPVVSSDNNTTEDSTLGAHAECFSRGLPMWRLRQSKSSM